MLRSLVGGGKRACISAENSTDKRADPDLDKNTADSKLSLHISSLSVEDILEAEL